MFIKVDAMVPSYVGSNVYVLGCGFLVSSADFWLCLHKLCGKADRGRLARQQREFKTHRKSTAQAMREGGHLWFYRIRSKIS